MATKISHTDILIVGSGASGMISATCAAAYGLNARVIDKRSHRITVGHADGVMSRTMEILDSFGLANDIVQQAQPLTRTSVYAPGEHCSLERKRTVKNEWQIPTPFPAYALGQAKILDILEKFIIERSSIRVERGLITEQLAVNKDEEYPVELVVRQTGSTDDTAERNNSRIDDDKDVLSKSRKDGRLQEVIRAKYLIACDGAHSWIRRTLGIEMVGASTDIIWGVMDIMPITNFPTSRHINHITGKGHGLLWIPREQGLVRIYCVLDNAETDKDGKLIRESVTLDMIWEEIQARIHPFEVSYQYCEWWAAYQIGQRVATDNSDKMGRVFLTGDAVHTVSPQAGQGMNASMQDSYNLLWKLNLVLKGYAVPNILQTYREERMPVAQRLVDFDRVWSAVSSGRDPPSTISGQSLSAEEVRKKHYASRGIKTQGLEILYSPNKLTFASREVVEHTQASIDNGCAPPGIIVGMRMPGHVVKRQCDDCTQSLHKGLASNGRFKFVLFAGDVSQLDKMERLKSVTDQIESLQLSLLIDVVTVHTSPKIEQLDLPRTCNPFDKILGYDYSKVYYDEDIYEWNGVHIGSAYRKYGIDEAGLLVLVRPDGYVAYQGEFEAFDAVRRYFEGFVIRTPV